MKRKTNKVAPVAPVAPELPDFPDLILCLGMVDRDMSYAKFSAFITDESTGEGCSIPYNQALSAMKTRHMKFLRRVSVINVQAWIYRMVKPDNQSSLQEMMTMMTMIRSR